MLKNVSSSTVIFSARAGPDRNSGSSNTKYGSRILTDSSFAGELVVGCFYVAVVVVVSPFKFG